MTLTEFLTARLDDDEATARRTVQYQYGYDSDGPNGVLAAAGRLGREVEAKRAIVSRYARKAGRVMAFPNLTPGGEVAVLRLCVMDIAAVYSDHPDYSAAVVKL